MAHSGAARQIENLSWRLGEDAKDAQVRRFMVHKRHQDLLERLEESHRREVQDLHVQLEAERDRSRSLQAKASILAADLEEAATAGMLHIVDSLGNSDIGAGNDRRAMSGSRITPGFESQASVATPFFSPSYTSVFALPLDQKQGVDDGVRMGDIGRDAGGNDEDGGLMALVPPTPQSLPRSVTPGSRVGALSALQRRQLVSLSTPSPPSTSKSRRGVGVLPSSLSASTSLSVLSSGASSLSVSAALYRSQLDHIAVRSKTEERLLHARKRMAAARAKEADLELRALQFGLS